MELAEIIERALNDCISILTTGKIKTFERISVIKDKKDYLVMFMNVANKKHEPKDIAGYVERGVKEYVKAKARLNPALNQLTMGDYASAIAVVSERNKKKIEEGWSDFCRNQHYH